MCDHTFAQFIEAEENSDFVIKFISIYHLFCLPIHQMTILVKKIHFPLSDKYLRI